jgi:hypothetical protein
MILEAETLIKYGYLSMDLKPDSNEPIQAACDECGKMRKTSKNSYRALCKSCAAKGKFPSEKSKALMSTKKKGKYGKDASAYKGGVELVGLKADQSGNAILVTHFFFRSNLARLGIT